MSTKDCFQIEKFQLLKTYLLNQGQEVKLQERLVATKEIKALEIVFQNNFIELVEQTNSFQIIIIDQSNHLPPFTCKIVENQLKLSAYGASYDTAEAIEIRKEHWCNIVNKLSFP